MLGNANGEEIAEEDGPPQFFGLLLFENQRQKNKRHTYSNVNGQCGSVH